MINQETGAAPLYRINKFVVPSESRGAFLDLMARTHAIVRKQQGVVGDRFFEQESGPAVFNFVTTVEFTGPKAIENVLAAVADFDRQSGIDRPQKMAKLGVKADMGVYRSLAI